MHLFVNEQTLRRDERIRYNPVELMITTQQIIAIADRITERFKPQRIILFGSYASGTPTEDSDLDLMIVMPYRGRSYDRAAVIRGALSSKISIDILVRSSGEILRRIAMNDFFIMDIVEKGIVLYDADDDGVGRKSRRRLRSRAPAAAIAQAQSI